MITKGELRLIEQKEKELLELQKLYHENLPHKYGHKWYAWQREFFDSTERMVLLTASNQSGKSSCQQWKMVEWATNQALWGKLWRSPPRQFWYLYPTDATALGEWETKILPDVMPRGVLKDDPVFGWEVERTRKEINAIRFKSGVTVYFKTYGQNVHNLQAGSCDAIFCDEELIEDLYDELMFRLEGRDGYFHSVFTPTRNQLMWYLAMECIGKPQEKFVDAHKIIVTAYDCQNFDDGSPGLWSEAKIKRAISNCRSETEVQRRIFGKFVTEEGRLFPAFEPGRNLMPPRKIPEDWKIYSGVDIGSGGSSHPAAIVFLAIDPDGTQGEVFHGWRGDDQTTTNGDIFAKYLELRGNMDVQVQAYDSQAKDFVTIADRAGESFQKAEKAQDYGYGLVNTLLQSGALRIHDTEELQKLAQELMTVMEKTPKSNAKDDFCFAGPTLVHTSKGLKPISNIEPGELVLTRNGFRTVTARSERQGVTRLYKCQGRLVRCTENHKFWSGSDFLPIGSLDETSTFETMTLGRYASCLKQTLSSSTGSSSDATQKAREGTSTPTTGRPQITAGKASTLFTGKFGKRLTALFLRATPSITRTTMRLTTALRTWSACLGLSIRGVIWQSVLLLQAGESVWKQPWRKLDSLLQSGIDPQKVATSMSALGIWLGRTLKLRPSLATSAASPTRLGRCTTTYGSAQTSARAEQGSVLVSTMSKSLVEFVGLNTGLANTGRDRGALPNALALSGARTEQVFNITVEGENEYFANGILVSNCDALRFACATAVPWDWGSLQQTEKPPVPPKELTPLEREIKERRGDLDKKEPEGWAELEEDIAYWNDQY